MLPAGVDEPKLRLGAPPKLNVDGAEGNEGIDDNVEVVVDDAGAPKAKPPVDELDVAVACAELAVVDPNENAGVLVIEPNVANDGADVDGAPKLAPEPNAGAAPVVPLPDEITGGANGRGGLVAPKPNVVLADVVVVVDAPGG